VIVIRGGGTGGDRSARGGGRGEGGRRRGEGGGGRENGGEREYEGERERWLALYTACVYTIYHLYLAFVACQYLRLPLAFFAQALNKGSPRRAR